ncbi:MAG: glutamate racemase [Rikenellaceae bacterium]
MDKRPIGVYDSGMGGLSLRRAIRRSLPHESIVYLGDGKNCPYGDKSPSEITKYAFEAVEELLSYGCKMIVVACNTATSTAISQLRAAYKDIPFVGMEPAIKPACRDTKSGVVAVLATKRSLESDLYAETLSKYAGSVEIISQVGEGFVEIVEEGLEESEESCYLVKEIVDILISKHVDKIVLGCTHYPFLMPQIIKAVGERDIEIIDPSPAIVRRIERLLEQFDMAAPKDAELNDKFISFAGESYCNKLINKSKI